MEFMELCLLLLVAYLIFKYPKSEKIAFSLLVVVFIIIAFVFFAVDIQYMILPQINL